VANRTVSVVLQAEIGQYVSGMTKAAVATKSVGESADVTAKKAHKGFDLAGRGAMLFGASVAGALIGVVTKSMQFEKAMSGVAAATQAGASSLNDLRDAAIKAGADTQYSATEAANAITEMAKAGVSSADILNGGLNGALSLAAAGQLDVAEAAGIASTAMTQFSLSGSQLPHVADLLAAGAGKAMGSVDDLGQALNQAGLLASSTGISIEETTGTLAAFASAGLIGSDAGTSFKTMLQQLQNPSQQSQQLLDDLGISAYDASGNFVGLAGLAGQLQDKLGPLSQATRDQALAQIFGTDAARAATVLYREGAGGIENWTSKVNDAGYAQRQAAQLTDNLAGDLERLGGSFDTLLISIGQGLQGPLRGLVKMLGGLVDATGAVFKAFGNLPGPIQAAILAAAGWAAVGGKITGVFGAVQGKIQGFRQELELQQALLAMQSTNLSDADRALGGLGGTAERTGQKFGVARKLAGEFAKAIGPELGISVAVAAISTIADDFNKVVNAGSDAAREVAGLSQELDKMSNTERVGAIVSQIDDLRQKLQDTQAIVDRGLQAGGGSWIENMIGPTAGIAGQAAAIRDADAAANVYAEHIAELETKQRNTSAAADGLASSLGLTRDQVLQLADKYHIDLSGGLDAVYGRFLLLKNSEQDVDTATGNTSGQMDVLKGQLDNVAAAADAAKQQTDAFKLSLDILTGAHVSMIEAESALQSALAAGKGAMEGMHGAVLQTNGEFNLQSEAGRKASDVLLGVRDSGNQLISTMIQQGASSEEVRAKDAQLREGFIHTAMQMGISRSAAENLANQILGIPSERTTKINADTAAARSAIGGVQTAVDNLHGKTVLVSVKADGTVAAILGSSSAFGGNFIKVGFSEGGYTGPGGRMKPAGVVHAGEVVWNQDDVAAHGGPQRVDAMRKARTSLPGYATGGIVIDVDHRPFDITMSNIKRNLEPVHSYIGALNWAKTQVGKPYIWGGVGPVGYDCSGFMSAITNVIRGRSPYSRVGSTANFPWAGFGAGNGIFTIGSTPNAGGGIGHMAGTLLGVGVESTGDHVRVGGDARLASNSLFGTRAHLVADTGGVIPHGMAGLNLSGRPERMLDPRQTAAFEKWMTSQASAGATGGGGTPNITVHARVFVGNREITDIARVEATAVLGGHVRRQQINGRSQ
jgi:TP901 family phage tail tape measure protein